MLSRTLTSARVLGRRNTIGLCVPKPLQLQSKLGHGISSVSRTVPSQRHYFFTQSGKDSQKVETQTSEQKPASGATSSSEHHHKATKPHSETAASSSEKHKASQQQDHKKPNVGNNNHSTSSSSNSTNNNSNNNEDAEKKVYQDTKIDHRNIPAEEELVPPERKKAIEDSKKLELELRKKIVEQEATIKDLQHKVLLSLADQENTRRIAKMDVDSAKKYALFNFASQLLEVADNLALAIKAIPETEATKAFLQGVKMTESVLLKVLKHQNVIPIENPIGKPFDPNIHEPLMKGPSKEYKSGHVSHVLKPGYMHHERVLRATQVMVVDNPVETPMGSDNNNASTDAGKSGTAAAATATAKSSGEQKGPTDKK